MSFKNSFIVSLVFLLGVVFLILSVPQDSRAGVVPIDSNCCFSHDGTGCDNSECEDAVCNLDEFCCNISWDGTCVGLAESQCGDLCGPPPPPPGSDCCFTHDGTGCDNSICENFICTIDSFCCTNEWDPVCVLEATEFCAVCGGEAPELIRPIPTLNQWGLIALAGIMGLAALYILIRRNPIQSD